MMIPSCVLLAVPVLLLSGCDKEKETFQSFVDGNKLFEFMREEKRNEIVLGVASRPRELQEMKIEAVRALRFMTTQFALPETYDVQKVINFIQEDSELRPLVAQTPNKELVIMFALITFSTSYFDLLKGDPEFPNVTSLFLKDYLMRILRDHPGEGDIRRFILDRQRQIGQNEAEIRAFQELQARAQRASQPAPAAASGE